MTGFEPLIALPGAASAVVLARWLLSGRSQRRDGTSDRQDPDRRLQRTIARGGRLGVIVVAGASAALEPLLAPFWIVVALNQLIGYREFVPFSKFGMYATPSKPSWTLQYETSSGELVPIATFGIQPVAARKRFQRLVNDFIDDGDDLHVARQRAADDALHALIDHRGATAAGAFGPIQLVLIEFQFDASTESFIETRTVVGRLSP